MKDFTSRFWFTAALFSILVLAGGCAKENERSSNQINKEYIESWMSVHYPDVQPTGLGIYIIDDIEGTGDALEDGDDYAFVNYTVTDMDGNISSTTSEDIAKQVGTYKKSNYYGSHIYLRNKTSSPTGLLEILKGMKVGGTRTALIPGWLNVTADYSSAEEYFKKGTDGSNAIYTITLVDKTDDISAWQIDSLERFTKIHMDDVDSTFTGYYYQQLKAPADTAAMPDDTTYYINYTGRLLNGLVFDTTIEDTAKFYNIYSSSKTYTPIAVAMSSEVSAITIGSSDPNADKTSTIYGFAYCLSKLKLYEKGVCVFYSNLGYGASRQGNAIPAFSPLSFEIEMVDKPED